MAIFLCALRHNPFESNRKLSLVSELWLCSVNSAGNRHKTRKELVRWRSKWCVYRQKNVAVHTFKKSCI